MSSGRLKMGKWLGEYVRKWIRWFQSRIRSVVRYGIFDQSPRLTMSYDWCNLFSQLLPDTRQSDQASA